MFKVGVIRRHQTATCVCLFKTAAVIRAGQDFGSILVVVDPFYSRVF